MPETTHTLKFRADNRAVKVLGKDFQAAFDTRSPREFQREMTNLQRRLKDITGVQVQLVKELNRTAEGTERFKELESQLESVAGQAKTVKSAIGSITAAFKDLRGEQRRGFGAGIAQGLGVAGYIPSEAGMGRRIAGGIVGRGARRIGGIPGRVGGMQAPSPGMGGLTTMLGAIPIVGQAAAGAVQALSGMYQEAVAYHQARVENLQYLSGGAVARSARAGGAGITSSTAFRLGTMGKAVRKGRVSAAARGIAREELEREMWEPRVVGGRIATGGPAAGEDPYARRSSAALERLNVEQAVALARTAEGAKGKERIRKHYTNLKGMVLDKVAGDIVRDVAGESTQSARKERAARFRRAFGRVELPGAGFGARFGFRATETQAALSGFMQARGGEYTAGTRRQFEGGLAARRVFGIQFQTAGAFARMGEPGGGGMGNVGMANMLQRAFQMGLRGAQIPEFLQTLVSLGQTAEKQGIKLNESEFGRQSMLFKAIGIRGPQIGRVAAGVNQAAMDLSQRGVSSPVDMIMMRAAGYDPSQGLEGYSTAMNKIAGGMDLDTLNNLMQMATSGARGGVGGQGRQTSILMMRRFFGRLKTPIGPGQASTILDAYQQGKLGREHLAMLGRDIETGERRGAHTRMVAGARIGVGMVAGLTKTEAGMEARRIALGTKMAGTMVTLNTASLNAALAVSNFRGELQTVAKWMSDLTKKLSEVTEGGGTGVWVAIKEKLGIL